MEAMITDRQSAMLRNVLVSFSEAEDSRSATSYWRGDLVPHVWLRALPGNLWDVLGSVMP